jgi:hypothetical protein
MKNGQRFITRSFNIVLVTLVLPVLFSFTSISQKKNTATQKVTFLHGLRLSDLYQVLSLDSLGLSREAFDEAVIGYFNLQKKGNILKPSVLSIVDFSLPSFRKRLFVLDMENGKLLFNTLVAHGRNSGKLIATRFSNRFRSFESSLGFYLTGETYVGQKGYSLRLLGMEKGINSNAYDRGIVMHAAPYVSEEISRVYGRLGRSEGCPAIPSDIHRSVIEAIKDGTCLFIYGTDKRYANRSKLLRAKNYS